MARVNAARDSPYRVPWDLNEEPDGGILSTKDACTEVQPSLPIVAISMILPSA
jgi:hypothetical protein